MGANILTWRDGSRAQTREGTVRSLQGELDTDWLPDPWSWRDLDGDREALGDSPAGWSIATLLVPFVGGRQRRVPLLSDELRIALHRRTLPALTAAEPHLAGGVCGYRVDGRGGIRHYRDELARRRRREATLADRYPYVLITDLRRFFPSIDVMGVLQPLTEPLDSKHGEALVEMLAYFTSELGYAVPEGYAAARGLASACLAPLDAQVRYPFTRWIDDYRIFVPTLEEGSQQLAALAEQASHLGFDLSEAKTHLSGSGRVFEAASSLGDHSDQPSDVVGELRRLVHHGAADDPLGYERRVRYLLRMLVEQRHPQGLELLATLDVTEVPPSAMPRLAWLLAAMSDHPVATELATKLLALEDDFAAWRAMRLGPALWYLPPSVTEANLDRIANRVHTSPAVRRAWVRTLARHVPQRSADLASEEALTPRERRLVLAERDPTRAHRHGLGDVIASGPPVQSYL